MLKRLVLPEAYEARIKKDDWISPKTSEWRAFRLLFFPMSIIREADPQDLLKLQRMIEQVLAEVKEKEKRDDKTTE